MFNVLIWELLSKKFHRPQAKIFGNYGKKMHITARIKVIIATFPKDSIQNFASTRARKCSHGRWLRNNMWEDYKNRTKIQKELNSPSLGHLLSISFAKRGKEIPAYTESTFNKILPRKTSLIMT